MRQKVRLSSLICVLALRVASPALADGNVVAPPAQSAPTEVAPPPPTLVPAPPVSAPPTAVPAPASAPPVAASTTAPGQWVYTGQHGWLWMPYDQRFTYVDAPARVAQMYVYAPVTGWHWVSAPWVLGIGPAPVWGPVGPVRFSWYAHPWFHGGFVRYGGWVGHPGHWHLFRGRR